ncbi:MAG: TlpA family protein disulfide reductase [Candidatus Rokubacteria bacterium]|nr:TlpA family protein disulfide reductase [Candidatus Rokubacteria bacterium]
MPAIRRRALIASAVLVPSLAVLALLAYGFGREPRYIETPMLGRPAPPFTLTLFDGRTLRLEDLRGRVVLLNFWASWCPPCRAEAPMLEAMWRELKDQDVVFVGVNTQDEAPRAQAFLEEFGITYPNGRDPGGRTAIDYGVWGLPEAVIVGPAGRITYKHIGTVGRTLLAAKIDEARRGVVSGSQGRGEYQSTR